jgi:hypothetical protein
MAFSARNEEGQQRGPDLRLILVALVTSAAWVVVDWTRNPGLDVERLVTGGLFVLTLLVAWRGFEMFVATLRRHYELKSGLETFDEKAARIEAQFKRLEGR